MRAMLAAVRAPTACARRAERSGRATLPLAAEAAQAEPGPAERRRLERRARARCWLASTNRIEPLGRRVFVEPHEGESRDAVDVLAHDPGDGLDRVAVGQPDRRGAAWSPVASGTGHAGPEADGADVDADAADGRRRLGRDLERRAGRACGRRRAAGRAALVEEPDDEVAPRSARRRARATLVASDAPSSGSRPRAPGLDAVAPADQHRRRRARRRSSATRTTRAGIADGRRATTRTVTSGLLAVRSSPRDRPIGPPA